MRRQEHQPQDFIGFEQVMQIGAGMVLTGRASAIRVQRARVAAMARVANIDHAPAGEGLAGTARARRQDAIEHVDAARHRAIQIGRFADPHQIARPVDRHRWHGEVEDREHLRLPLADCQPADRVTVKADIGQRGDGAVTQVLVNAALDDAEQAMARP